MTDNTELLRTLNFIALQLWWLATCAVIWTFWWIGRAVMMVVWGWWEEGRVSRLTGREGLDVLPGGLKLVISFDDAADAVTLAKKIVQWWASDAYDKHMGDKS